jgi:hypothetical protein
MPSDRVTSEAVQDYEHIIILERAIRALVRMKASFTVSLCELCDEAASMRCSRCKMVSYCGAIHQKKVTLIVPFQQDC